MSVFMVMLFICMAAGIVLVVCGLIVFVNKKESSVISSEDTVKAVEFSVAEADNAINEMNKIAEAIFKEIEDKYQELLFLYSLIDEKKKDVTDIYNKSDVRSVPYEPAAAKGEKQRALTNPKLEKIMELVNQGVQLPEIAKRLNMGQGEVRMILELGKVR